MDGALDQAGVVDGKIVGIGDGGRRRDVIVVAMFGDNE